MMISRAAWVRYVNKLSDISDKAANEMRRYISKRGGLEHVERRELIDYAYAVATKYGEAATSLTAQFYDEIAEAAKAGVPAAVPAKTATISEVAKTINGTIGIQSEEVIVDATGRLVKLAGVDTTVQNALRDGAEWAWIPQGDTCPFCIMLASRGWQKASKKVLKGDHAAHVHANCDCTFAIRFDSSTDVKGYTPERYKRMYDSADGKTTREKLNSMRKTAMAKADKPEIDIEPGAKPAATAIKKFIPAKTRQEAEEFARQFAEKVSFQGMSLENANTVNRTLQTLSEKYPIKKLGVLEATPKTRGVASARYDRILINGKKLGKVLDEETENFALSQQRTRESIELIKQRWKGKKMPDRIQKDVERLERKLKFTRYGVHSSYGDHVSVTITHEYAHTLSDQYFGMINGELANPNIALNWSIRQMNEKWKAAYARALETGDIFRISEYASTNYREFFAECFTAREMGETLPDYVEELMKEVLEHGVMQ